MEPSSNFQKTRDTTVDTDLAFRGNGNSAQDLQHGALSGTVPADNPNYFTVFDIDRYVPKRPEVHLLNFLLQSGSQPRKRSPHGALYNVANSIGGRSLTTNRISLSQILDR